MHTKNCTFFISVRAYAENSVKTATILGYKELNQNRRRRRATIWQKELVVKLG